LNLILFTTAAPFLDFNPKAEPNPF